MSDWTLVSARHGRSSWSRPLGLTEAGFYWDSCFNRTADAIQHFTIKVPDRTHPDDEHIKQAWTAMKRRFPLLAARFNDDTAEVDGTVHFIVDEGRIDALVDDELQFHAVASESEAYRMVEDMLNGSPPLNRDLLAQMRVLRRTDAPNVLHIITCVAHSITDGMANATIARTFFELLCSPRSVLEEKIDLERRLAMAVSSESLDPNLKMTRARRRWRLAIGHVLWDLNNAQKAGGHTLPQRRTAATWLVPARSRLIVTSFTPSASKRLLESCRRASITFGHAMPVLAQLAAARLLYRRHLRGEISADEMRYRERQPMHTGGPLNLRPYMDRDWLARGGATEVGVCISFFFTTLPFMPRPSGDALAGGAPTFAALLDRKRFFLRAGLIKRQMTAFMRNPLFLELAAARLPSRCERVRRTAMQWKEGPPADLAEKPQDTNNFQDGLVLTHGGSSMGNVETIVPLNYPLPASHPLSIHFAGSSKKSTKLSSAADNSGDAAALKTTDAADKPLLQILSSRTHLHCRPGELYLGSSSIRGQLQMSIFWDENVYEEGVVQEWLDEVKAAAEWYLLHDNTRVHDSSAKARL